MLRFALARNVPAIGAKRAAATDDTVSSTDRSRLVQSLVPRGLLASARRTLDRVAARAIARVSDLRSTRLQKVALSALREVALRWPELARLVGIVEPASPPVGGKRGVNGAAPAPAGPERTTLASESERGEHLARLRSGHDFAERARAAQRLAGVVDRETTAALVAALRDPSSEVAVQAAEALARHGGEVAVGALRGVVQNIDGYVRAETRAAAVRALGALLPPGEGTPIAAAASDSDATVSLAAIAALSGRDEASSSHALLAVLEDRAGYYLPLTRQAAARALAHLGRRDGSRVRALLETEADTVVRDALAALAAT